jgi:multimeric flavodoxin WrbA
MEGKVNVLIHDRNNEDIENIIKDNPEEIVFFSDNGNMNPCIGCFGCWIKTPGQCVIKDGYEKTGVLLTKCNRMTIISQCFYGGYSPPVKNILDRSICPYLLPYFTIKNGEMHHSKRNKIDFILLVHFYGKIQNAEKETARKLVTANGINLSQKTTVFFYDSFEEIKGL